MALTTIPAVPLLETGREYQLSTGPATFTEEDLAAAAAAPVNDAAVKVPRIRIAGFSDNFDPAEHGGEPAFGRVENMRVVNAGQTLVGDVVIPEWLAAVADWAYPNRSIEGSVGVTTVTGQSHELVITALALLGVDLPGVSTLDDLSAVLAGDDLTDHIEAAGSVAASAPRYAGEIRASLDSDIVMRRFYDRLESGDYVVSEGVSPWMIWARSMRFDDNGKPYLICQDDENGSLYRVDFAVSGNDVTFKPATEVVEQYVAASAVTVAPVRVFANRAESRPVTNEEDGMTPEQRRIFAERFGLDPESATDEQIMEAAQNMPPPPEGAPAPEADADPTSEPTPEQDRVPVAASAPETVTVTRAQWEETQGRLATVETDLTTRTEREQAAHRDGLIAAALHDGRITPAERDGWRTGLDDAPEATEKLLASLARGRVPVAAASVQPQEGEPGSEEEHETYMATHFPQASRARRGSHPTRQEA